MEGEGGLWGGNINCFRLCSSTAMQGQLRLTSSIQLYVLDMPEAAYFRRTNRRGLQLEYCAFRLQLREGFSREVSTAVFKRRQIISYQAP